jgi:hypothetical protein
MIDERGDAWRVITKIASGDRLQRDAGAGARRRVRRGAGALPQAWSTTWTRPKNSIDPLPGFHITPRYLEKLRRHGRHARPGRERLNASMEARRLAKFIERPARRSRMCCRRRSSPRRADQLRVMHGDPKVNNVMIDDFTGKGTAMIDLDTVSPGLVHYDFGDAVRSICNPAGEEELNLNKVVFDMDLCLAFCKGYLSAGATPS